MSKSSRDQWLSYFSASGYGSEGEEFEPSRTRHLSKRIRFKLASVLGLLCCEYSDDERAKFVARAVAHVETKRPGQFLFREEMDAHSYI